jgi:hypothetical protein
MMMSQNMQVEVQGSVTSNNYCVLVGADCKILKNLNYGNEMEVLRLEYKLEIIYLYEVSSLSESETGRQHGLNSLTLLTILKNTQKIQYILNPSKLALFLSS